MSSCAVVCSMSWPAVGSCISCAILFALTRGDPAGGHFVTAGSSLTRALWASWHGYTCDTRHRHIIVPSLVFESTPWKLLCGLRSVWKSKNRNMILSFIASKHSVCVGNFIISLTVQVCPGVSSLWFMSIVPYLQTFQKLNEIFWAVSTL